MTIDQMLYVAARIHDWDKDVIDITKRTIDIVKNCEAAVEANNDVKEMVARGISPIEMIREKLMSGMPPTHLQEEV
jgi:uncharacterized protein with PhoU and TrkA domain